MVLIGESELLLSYTQNLINDNVSAGLATAGFATITRVQGNARGTATGGTTINVAMANNPTNGNILIAVIAAFHDLGSGSLAVSSITQTGVTWSRQVQQQDTTDYDDIEIWAGVVGSGASTSVTVTISTSINYNMCADICEYSGLLASGFLDKTAVAGPGTSGSNGSTGTTATVSQNCELFVGGITVMAGVAQSNPTNGFTMLDGASNGYCGTSYLEKIVTGGGTAGSGTTITTGAWNGCIATFKAAPILPTIKTYNGSIPQNELFLYSMTLTNPSATTVANAQIALLLNGQGVYGTGAYGTTNGSLTVPVSSSVTVSGMLYAPSGAFNLVIGGFAAVGSLNLTAVQAGLCNFNDLGVQYGAYTTALTVSTTQRMTPLGNLTQTMLYVRACSGDSNSVQFENPADDFTYGVQIAVDSVQQSWTERYQGSGSGAEASAMLMTPLTVGSGVTHTVTVTKRNSATNVYLSLVATCPWILPPSTVTNYFPVTSFNFTPGCTVYCTTEPLHVNNSTFIGVGKTRSITFGQATDFYAYMSGAGILPLNFQFNYVDVVNSILVAYGFGGCLAYVGVDTV